MSERIVFEGYEDQSATLSIVHREGHRGLAITVSEELAVDSYNRMFQCSHILTEAEAIELRNWFIKQFPQHETKP